MLEEMRQRHGPYPAGFSRDILHRERLPLFAAELGRRAAEHLSGTGMAIKDVLVKFGKRQHMERLYEEGGLRIQPATLFAETNHNEAIRDDERLRAFSFAVSWEEMLKLVVNPRDVPQNAPEHRIDVNFQWPSDYWLYCVSSSIEPRLFVNYNADCCVIIKDHVRFAQMLRRAVYTSVLTGIPMSHGPIEYFDPLLPKTHKILVPRAKHFRYSYQNEYRFAWLPPKPMPKAEHVDVEIGSLKEFCDLIVL
jgi:hypothetical protein